MIQNHVHLLSGKAHPFSTRSTETATDAVALILDMCPRSGAGFPDSDDSDVLVVRVDERGVPHFHQGHGLVPHRRATRCAATPTDPRTTGTVTSRAPSSS